MEEKEGDEKEARELYQKSHDVLEGITKAGKQVSSNDLEVLESLKQTVGIK